MIAGIVLAAGRSSRMGEPKALLRLEGLTFLERAVQVLARGGCGDVWVVVGQDPAVRAEAERTDASVLVNPDPEAEQIDSLRLALRALPPVMVAAMVLPVDVPGADAGVARSLAEAHRLSGIPIVLPAADGRHGHPVLFARSVWPDLLAPDLPEGARSVVHDPRHRRLELRVASLPADVDTPDDYRTLLEGGR